MRATQTMGHFTAIGMRTKVEPNSLIINTCGRNDTNEKGSLTSWVWSNPTNRRYPALYKDIQAVSTECLWQGTKLIGTTTPDAEILAGNWRKNKGRKPTGAYAGFGQQPITNPGTARCEIYLPAFRNQILSWLRDDPEVQGWVDTAKYFDGPVFLRDFDTGRGVYRNGPMSHAWVLAIWLNTGDWPN